jgi:hypothetical protein
MKLATRYYIREIIWSGELVAVDPLADNGYRARLSILFDTPEAAVIALEDYIKEKGMIPNCTIIPFYNAVPA